MADEKGSLRDQVKLAIFQTAILGTLTALFSLWLNMRLERYKSELADDTERLKTALQVTTPLIQKRYSGYLEIQQAARNVNWVLEHYYVRAKQPFTDEAMSGKLRALENTLKIGSESSGGYIVLRADVTHALNELITAREKYADISSPKVNDSVDQFLNIVMDDVRKGELRGNQTEAFDTAARAHLKDAFGRLNAEINQALGMDKPPIK